VVGEGPGIYPAVYGVEASGTPLLVPRTPALAHATPTTDVVSLDWEDNTEADFSHYEVYRAIANGAFSLYEANQTTSDFVDNNVQSQIEYRYQIVAVDNDGYQSDPTAPVSAYAATFDGGILIVDEITYDALMPDEAGQLAWFDSLFGGVQYTSLRNDASGDAMSCMQAGRYSSVFWMDDDLSSKFIYDSDDSLRWYVQNPVNLLVEGWRTMTYWYQHADPGTMLYDYFGISSYTMNQAQDFAGATGLNGWPDIQVDLTNPFGNLPYIPIMTLRPGTVPIYSFDSNSDDPTFEGQPCAVMVNDGDQKRILLGFPLHHLTAGSAEALVAYAAAQFGEGPLVIVAGDLNNDGDCDPVDLSVMVDHMFSGGAPPVHANSADVNGDCTYDPVDLSYFVDFFFSGGLAPVMGCVE
jgi:hypothetical protein